MKHNGIRFERGMDPKVIAEAIYFHISTISDTDDVDTIKTCLVCIYELIEGTFDITRDDLKKYVINGVGIFNEISKKCIELGVV